jgi:hypothetical protein
MSPITHFLAGYLVAQAGADTRRDRALVTLAGVAPDFDGFGLPLRWALPHSERALRWWSDYHHVLGHNLLFGMLLAAAVFAAARKRYTTAALALLAFHLHLLCDVLGSGGPEGEIWAVPYLWPFSRAGTWTWSGQWALNAWPNLLITALGLAAVLALAWKRGYSPLEFISLRADKIFVQALRQRLGEPRN